MRRTSSLLLALLLCSPAWAGSQVLLIYDPVTAKVQRIVVPDNDAELNDPSYAPAGTAQMKIPAATYRATPTVKAIEQLLPKPAPVLNEVLP